MSSDEEAVEEEAEEAVEEKCGLWNGAGVGDGT
jgi:hypothetical protein